MSKTTERLVAVTNELTDIVAQFEETQRPKAEWQDDAWNELMTNIQNEDLHMWEFDGDSHPVAILHELYMAFKDEREYVKELLEQREQERIRPVVNVVNAADPVQVNAHLQQEELRRFIRDADALHAQQMDAQLMAQAGRIDWHTLRAIPERPEDRWNLPPHVRVTNGDNFTDFQIDEIRGPDVT